MNPTGVAFDSASCQGTDHRAKNDTIRDDNSAFDGLLRATTRQCIPVFIQGGTYWIGRFPCVQLLRPQQPCCSSWAAVSPRLQFPLSLPRAVVFCSATPIAAPYRSGASSKPPW